ncbi:RHS repeat-associated core domain-containing protein [Neisseria dumasiana]|uniref:RHS repeat-associated core domain-containing protein n=1 Tax=Neisseria dumasiana TaxID=1931275 RepID=UPI00209C4FF5|nr:RHS repeat-associated core domain-containing protein [Neisseria dumasiana]
MGKGNRLEAYNGTEYTYDALGNMIYRQLPDGESQLFQYDSENQLIRAEIKKPKGNTEIWEYAYDPFGRRLSKERKDKLAWTSTAPKRTHFVWDGTRLLQEYTYKGSYTYVYTDQDSYEPLAQVFDNHKDQQQYLFYFHNNQIGTPHEMTDIHGNLLWYGSYSAWGSLSSENKIYPNIHQPFRLQNQYFDAETGLHYNFFRYYEVETGRFTNQDPIGLLGGDNLYFFTPNANVWVDPLGLSPQSESAQRGIAKAVNYLTSKGFTIISDEVSIKVLDRTGKKLKKVRIRPDIVAMKDGKIYFIEVKNNKGRLTKGQRRSGLFNLKKPHNAGGKCSKAAYIISTKNKDKQAAVGSNKGVAHFMTLVFKD